MKLKILHEDNHIIAVNKDPGILSQRDIRNIPSLYDYIKDYIKKKYNKPGEVFLGIVHRLDRSVSGVMVFARTSKAARRLQTEMFRGEMHKFYVAIVQRQHNIPRTWQTLEDHLQKVHGGTEVLASGNDNGKIARLSYICIEESGPYALLCINLHTGRKHQIRSQLASRGMPIVGDEKYGSDTALKNTICLHALYLKFKHPTRDEQIELIEGIPGRFSEIMPSAEKFQEKIIDIIHSVLL